jgi:signal transduction histidine kinase/phage shock protein PspC (stress-responsive transcriptional regulator)
LDRASLPPRSRHDRVVGGVCGGLGAALGVEAVLLRIAAVVLVLTGPGIPIYVVAWLALPDEPADGLGSIVLETDATSRRGHARRVLGVALTVFGVVLVARDLGMTPRDAFVGPILLIATGVGAVVWHARAAAVTGTGVALRVAAGIVVVAVGLIAFIAGNLSFDLVVDGMLATALVVGGLALILGPWIAVLVRERGEERRRRIRADERAEVAAHLHDSVLQTFALIQRADDPRQMSALARHQERELRRWLFDAGSDPGAATVRAAFERVAAEIEDRHGVTIETVVVGDGPIDSRGEALVAAAAEAMANAAKWSGETHISTYVEVGDDAIEAFVRDTGVGFDEALVDPDRLGVKESIRGRMARVDGEAEISTAPGEGVEVRLRVPRN